MRQEYTFVQILLLFLFLTPTLGVDKDVLSLSDSKFQKQLSTNDNLLVMFLLPWSGLCQKLRPHFAQAAQLTKENNLPITFAKVDCSGAGKKTCVKEKVGHHVPAIFFYRKGKSLKEYTGSRFALSIFKFVRVQVLPAAVELKSVEEFKNFLQKHDDVLVIGFFEEETKLKRMFFRVAEAMKEVIIFAYSSCEKLLFKEGVLDGIVLYRPVNFLSMYEEEKVLFSGRVVIGEIKNFIYRNYHGLVGKRDPVNSPDFTNPLIVLYYTADYRSDGKEPLYWKNRILKIAHKYQKSVKFAISAKDDFEDLLAPYNVDYTSVMKPFIMATDLENKNYIMTDDFSAENLDKFVDDFVSGRLAPYIRSKPIPSKNDGAVLVAVARNFDDLVMRSDKDTFLTLYVPAVLRYWKFKPVLREIADLLLDEEVQVVKMDIVHNEIPEMLLMKTKPVTLYWVPKNRKKRLILYEGERRVDDIIRFIARKATKELLHYNRDGRPKQEMKELHEREEL